MLVHSGSNGLETGFAQPTNAPSSTLLQGPLADVSDPRSTPYFHLLFFTYRGGFLERARSVRKKAMDKSFYREFVSDLQNLDIHEECRTST
jgi:hypothetical protein